MPPVPESVNLYYRNTTTFLHDSWPSLFLPSHLSNLAVPSELELEIRGALTCQYPPTIVTSLVPSPGSHVLLPALYHQEPLFSTTYQLGLSDRQGFPFFIRVKGLSCYNIKTQQCSKKRTMKFLSTWQSKAHKWATWLHSVIRGLGFIPSHHVSPPSSRATVSSAQLKLCSDNNHVSAHRNRKKA